MRILIDDQEHFYITFIFLLTTIFFHESFLSIIFLFLYEK